MAADDEGTVTAILDCELRTSNLAPYGQLALHDLSIDDRPECLARHSVSERRAVNMGLLHFQGPQS